MNEYEQALTMILKLEDTVAELLEALEEIANYENDFSPHMTGGDAHTMRVAARKATRKHKGD